MSGLGRCRCLRGNQIIFAMENAWMEARLALLEKERALTRMIDEVTDERRRMPRERMEKEYVFEGVEGKVGLAGLFDGKRKLIVQHFMFAPDWEEGCPGCSFGADASQGMLTHLETQGFAFAAISLAPVAKLEAFKKRMGWHFNWVSSGNSDFDYDFHVAFPAKDWEAGQVFYNYKRQPRMEVVMPGVSLFERGKDGEILHVWSGYGREAEQLIPSLTTTLIGQDERGPKYDLASWVKLRDKYAEQAASCCHGVAGGVTV
jgi:predicted dithiol-disulfide oxidoreductase (DUF899 family)